MPNLQSAPLIVDEDDLDGDEDNTELRPDYRGNPEVRMTPTISQDLRVQVRLPETSRHRRGSTSIHGRRVTRGWLRH